MAFRDRLDEVRSQRSFVYLCRGVDGLLSKWGVSREGESALLEMILAWATRDPLLGTNY